MAVIDGNVMAINPGEDAKWVCTHKKCDIEISTWLVTLSNPVKPKGHLKKYNYLPTKFISLWTLKKIVIYLKKKNRSFKIMDFTWLLCKYYSIKQTLSFIVQWSLWQNE